jgi:hypothetical protein
LIVKANETSRTVADWFLEGISMLTFSRPAICLLKATDDDRLSHHFTHAVDWLQLAALLVVAAGGLSICFSKAQSRWRQSV